jgi:hypothetical protein
VNIEFHQAFVSHFQPGKIGDCPHSRHGAFHGLVDFELFSQSALRIFSRSFSMTTSYKPGTLMLTLE